MGTNAWDDRHLLLQRGGEDIFGYPSTHAGWQERYMMLLDLANGGDYDQAIVKAEQAFRAFDDNGKVIGTTRTYYNERGFVLGVAVAAIALGQVVINPAEGASGEDVELAKGIWARSSLGDADAMTLAACGDLYIEPARADAGSSRVTLITYLPQQVIPVYGMVHSSRLERVTITSAVQDDPLVDANGHVTEAGATYTHQRIVDRREISVAAVYPKDAEGAEQRRVDQAASGPHNLGVCPVQHVRFIPAAGYPEHSLAVTSGLDRGEILINGLLSRIKAVGDRYGNPIPYLFGAQLGNDSLVTRLGRWLNVWGKDADKVSSGYLEPNMAGITALSKQLDSLLGDIRASMPEYLFNSSTANLSAEALRLLASQYEAKYLAIRRRLYGAIETAIAIGVAMEQQREYDPAYKVVTLTGPDLMPGDVLNDLEALIKAREVGGITTTDVVRRTQALGLADQEMDAAEYAQLVAEEQMGRASMLLGGGDPLDELGEE